MSLFALIQVAIAVIFIYLILSLVASEIQEQIAAILEFRAKTLKRSLQILLGEGDGQGELIEALYDSSQIQALNQYSQNIWCILTKHFRKRFSAGPSYIEKEVFVAGLMEVLQSKFNSDGSDLTSNQPLSKIVTKLESLQALGNAKTRLVGIAKKVLLENAEANLGDFREELGALFDRAQERMSGSYKRNAKSISWFIGLSLAVGLNVDAIQLVRTLGQNPGLAAELANVAGDIEVAKLQECLSDNGFAECEGKARAFLSTAESELQQSGVGLGNIIGTNPLERFNGSRFLGWILSAIAISMGAPFWFEVLGRFLKVRNAGETLRIGKAPERLE